MHHGDDGFHSRLHTELAIQMVKVKFDGLGADAKFTGDGAVALAVQQQIEHLSFSPRQHIERSELYSEKDARELADDERESQYLIFAQTGRHFMHNG